MRLITIALLTIFLTSCRSVTTQMVCSEVHNQEIKPVEMCDISFQFNRCRCRLMDINSWTSKSPAVDHPIGYCEGVAGYRLTDIATEIRPKIKALNRLKENLCDSEETVSSEDLQSDQEATAIREFDPKVSELLRPSEGDTPRFDSSPRSEI